MKKKLTKSSNSWLQRQSNDIYTKQAKALGYRSRAAFKLLEINLKKSLIRPGMTIVDLGAAPGGWLQVAQKAVGIQGKVIGLDILPIVPITDVDIIEGDFAELDTFHNLMKLTCKNTVDVVMSDMAPNLSGITTVDQAKAIYLAELALEFARQTLNRNGQFLVKVFQGAGTEDYIKSLKEFFASIRFIKPKASRTESREIYILANGFNKKNS